MNVYRISPALWTYKDQSLTVYVVDRQPPPDTFTTRCSTRTKEDPAYYWESGVIHRIVPSWDSDIDAITWSTLPRWLSYVQTVGYTVDVNFSKLKPYSDIYIKGP